MDLFLVRHSTIIYIYRWTIYAGALYIQVDYIYSFFVVLKIFKREAEIFN